MRWLIPALTFLLASCTVAVTTGPVDAPDGAGGPPAPVGIPASQVAGVAAVVAAVQPAATRECRRRAKPGTNCNFLVLVDPDPRAEPNAFQSLDPQGRPVLTITAPLIDAVNNADELAFILGHEAAHHIAGHLERQERNAADGARVFAELATLTGGESADVETAQKLGAAVGARAYSREFELEADELGTLITHRAGFDALRGAEFFMRIPDPGDRFLASHPANAARLDLVRRTVARLGPPG